MNRREFPRVTPESVGIPSAAIEALLDKLEKADDTEPHALMIMRHGKVCAEGWWQPYAPGVPHALFSLTKAYTATAVGIAYTEGLLDLDDNIIDYFPEYVNLGSEHNSRVTIRHALTMASGKPENRSDTADWRKHYFGIPFNAKPGTAFEYSCEDTHVLVAIIQRVSGLGLHDYLASRLFDRIGIDSKNLKWVRLPDGTEVGAGGLFATAEDSLRLMKLYLDGGIWEGERILAEDYVEQATSSQINIPNGYGYGFQMFMGSKHASFYGAGALGQAAIVFPDQQMIVVLYQTGIYSRAGPGPLKIPEHYFEGVENVFSVLEPAVTSVHLPKHGVASNRLEFRMRTLSLGRAVSRPAPAIATAVSGKTYRVENGTVTLRSNIWNHITANEPFHQVVGINWFSFVFDRQDSCTLTFEEHGNEATLTIGLDGIRRLNSYALQNTCIDKVLLDGSWETEDTFCLNARWLETSFSIGISFRFLNTRVVVGLKTIRGDYDAHPLRTGLASAILA